MLENDTNLLNLTKSSIKENKEIKVKKYQENLSLISSITLKKLSLRQKMVFL